MYTMLIVDDEPIERKGIETLLKKLEMPVECSLAENGNKALQLLREGCFDILLTDIKMPFMDGITLAHEARQLFPDMMIIVLSAYRDFEKAQAAIDEQVFRYLLKPVEPKGFRAMMESCFEAIEKKRNDAQKHSRMESDLQKYQRLEAQLRSCLMDNSDYIDGELIKDLLASKDVNVSGIDVSNPAVQQTMRIIHAEYMNDISLESIAARVGLNYGYLSTLFHQQTGQSFVRYLNTLRLEIAARMLRSGSVKINEVAAKVGFQKDSYFISSFKQRFGLTPRNYSKQMRDE